MSDLFPSGWWIPPAIICGIVVAVIFGVGYLIGAA